MKEFRYSLEKYKGTKTRHECPSCGKRKTFALYLDTDTGNHVHPSVGRCNREDHCNYHLTPKEYFEQNGIERNENWKPQPLPKIAPLPMIRIEPAIMQKSLTGYDNNNFVKYLVGLFGEELSAELVAKYFIGSSKHWGNSGANVFWQIDTAGIIRTGKVMLYDSESGKRVKKPFNHIQWVHKLTKQPGELKQCFFGEHLLRDKTKTLAIVESEKTAIIASVYFPQFIWLACGGLSMLSYEKCQALKGRKVILFPDLNGFEKWSEKVSLYLPKICTSYSISELLEKVATSEEKQKGLDLADYLVRFSFREFEVNPLLDANESQHKPQQVKELKELLTQALNELIRKLPKDVSVVIDGTKYPCLKTVVQMVNEGWRTNHSSKFFQDRIREIFQTMHAKGYSEFENKY